MCCNPSATDAAPADETLPSVDVATAADRPEGVDAHNVTGGIIAWAEARLPADFT